MFVISLILALAFLVERSGPSLGCCLCSQNSEWPVLWASDAALLRGCSVWIGIGNADLARC